MAYKILVKDLYHSIIAPYEGGDYADYVRASYLRFVNLALFVFIPIIIFFNVLYLRGWTLELMLPLGALSAISGANLMLLAKGRLATAAHTLFVVSMAGVWAIMFTDQGSPLTRINTIVYVFCLLAMLPLLVQQQKWVIPVYYAINGLIFFLFLLQQQGNGLTPQELYDTGIDTYIALIFTGIASWGIFTVSQRTLAKVHDEKHALESTRKLLNRIIDEMPSILLSLDDRGNITTCNKMALDASCLDPHSQVGASILDAFPSLRKQDKEIRSVIQGGPALVQLKTAILENAPTTLFDLTVYPLTPGQPDGAVVRLDDVTRQVEFEQMMVQSEKMSSVGGLAAGMAHEINNPLSGILQGVQVIDSRLDAQNQRNIDTATSEGTSIESIRRYLEQRRILQTLSNIRESGTSAARIVANMLNFARKETGQKTPVNINMLMTKVMELASSDYNLKKDYDFRKIQISTDFEPNLPRVPGESAKIQQVLLNILRNGVHAMQADKQPDAAPPAFTLRTWSTATHVYIAITDTGPGIPENIRNRIFEPFFTTKGIGIGTGLGLSVSYFIIVEDHAGTLEVTSPPHQGATFTVGLPL